MVTCTHKHLIPPGATFKSCDSCRAKGRIAAARFKEKKAEEKKAEARASKASVPVDIAPSERVDTGNDESQDVVYTSDSDEAEELDWRRAARADKRPADDANVASARKKQKTTAEAVEVDANVAYASAREKEKTPAEAVEDADAPAAAHNTRRCHNCNNSYAGQCWNSKLNAGHKLCQNCSLHERKHNKPRPESLYNKQKISDRRCFNCDLGHSHNWNRSKLNPGCWLCANCGKYEAAYNKPRPRRLWGPEGNCRGKNKKDEQDDPQPPTKKRCIRAESDKEQLALAEQEMAQFIATHPHCRPIAERVAKLHRTPFLQRVCADPNPMAKTFGEMIVEWSGAAQRGNAKS